MLSETLYNSFVTETYNFAEVVRSQQLKWNHDVREDDLIVDVGCGVNQISTDFISKTYTNARKLYIDNDPEVIRYFKKINTSGEYAQIDILDWPRLQTLEGSVSTVVALRCLSEVEDQNSAFEIIFRMLKPGGNVLILLTINSLFYHFLTIVVQKDRWREYFKGKYVVPESHTKHFTADYYKSLLTYIGFEHIAILEVPRVVTYTSILDFSDDVFHSRAGRCVPEEHRLDFAVEVATFAEFHRSKMIANEYLDIKYSTLWIYAIKSQKTLTNYAVN